MEPKEWDYNEVLASVAKAMGVDLEDIDDEDDEDAVHFCGVKSSTQYFGGQKVKTNPSTKIYLDDDPGPISIDFDHNY